MKQSIRERIVRLEARRRIHEREELPALDVSVLTTEQRDYIRDAARLVAAEEKGLIQITSEQRAFIEDAFQLLLSCPPYPKVSG